MTCQVLYFATLQTEAGTAQETINLPQSPTTCAELYDTLRQKYQFTLSNAELRVAKNHSFCDWQSPIANGDIIAFIPPVSGG